MSDSAAQTLVVRRFGDSERKSEAAIRDLIGGLREWNLWSALAWLDVKQRYRRAVLGPFWITIGMSVLVVALGIIYAGMFRIEIREFLPYIAAGFIFWALFSSTITEATAAFTMSEGLIKQGGIPLSLHVYRTVYRNVIIGAHNFAVMLLIYIWQPDLLSWKQLLVIPGLALVIVNLTWISLLVGVLCTRYRDLPPVVVSLLQIAFFVSPIMFKPTSLPPQLLFIISINPIFYFVDVVRAPLLGQLPSPQCYPVLAGCAIVGAMVTFKLFQIARSRVPYWV